MVAGLWLLSSIAFAHVVNNIKLCLVKGYNYVKLGGGIMFVSLADI